MKRHFVQWRLFLVVAGWLCVPQWLYAGDIYATFCQPTNYLIGCQIYNESGNYDVDMGDGSTTTLHLTIGAPSSVAVSDSIVLGGTYLFGCQTIEATALGVSTYTDSLTNALGCDSVVTLSLRVYEAACDTQRVTIPAAICAGDSVEFFGSWYKSAGTYYDTIPTVSGCDSIGTLVLTVNQPTTGDTTAVVCAADLPYLWHGLEAIGDTTYTTANVAGCDSVIMLHLVVNHPTTGEETVTLCAEELPYLWNGLEAVGDTSYTTTNVAGCDSVATLRLAVNGKSYLNTPAFDHIDSAIVNPYSNHLLLLNFQKIEPALGWTNVKVNEQDVEWYREGETEVLGTGFYYMNGDGTAEVEAGNYYVLLRAMADTESGCMDIARAFYRVQGTSQAVAPVLRPTSVRPSEQLWVLNINADEETTICVYSPMGTLLATYTTHAGQFALRAADQPGYYLVRVSNAAQDQTLRYVVK